MAKVNIDFYIHKLTFVILLIYPIAKGMLILWNEVNITLKNYKLNGQNLVIV